MDILATIYEKIVSNCPKVPPETGGIIGETAGVVTHYEFDSGNSFSNGYDTYSPNAVYLNQIIIKWASMGVHFCGIYHSHFPSGIYLSKLDRQYISKIMTSMPEKVNKLYFPIVFPSESMIVYQARNVGSQIDIVRDKLSVIGEIESG